MARNAANAEYPFAKTKGDKKTDYERLPEPIDNGTMFTATAAAEPLEEPPGVRVRSWGLAVLPGE